MPIQSEHLLHESEARVRLILDSTAEAIFGCDSAGNCLFSNSSAARILGYDSPDELLGKDMHGLEHHTRKDGTSYPLEECPIYLGFQKGEAVHRDDEIFWRKDGTSFPVEYWSHPIVAEGKTLGAVITFFDITDRKRAEEALRKSEERNRSLLAINNAIITNLTQHSLLRSIHDALHTVVSFDRCAITVYERERDTFRFLAVEGDLLSDHFHEGLEYRRSETSVGWVFENRRTLVRHDLAKEAQYANEIRLAAEDIRSICVSPLTVQENCIGTLSVVSRQANRYSEEEVEFLQEVANQIALAIQNMQAYREIASLKANLEKENIYLREELRTEHNFEEIVGRSPALLSTLHLVEQVASTDTTVLICGETGTGKELIARAIHSLSSRRDRALINVNCCAISAGLVESELFGHMKGAFTGALERRIGRFELADGGTIFLDEIGDLPLETQVKLLRVLQEQEFEPVGSSRPVRVDVRVIVATNRNLAEAVQAGSFRSDLFYRVNVFPLQLPPLRERGPDIPELATFYVSRFSKRFNKQIERISRESMEHLMNYHWPGNIRELQNVIERAVILCSGSTLRLDRDLVPISGPLDGPEDERKIAEELSPEGPNSQRSFPTLTELERRHILNVLGQTGGVIDGPKGAARILDLHPNTLRHRMDKLGIARSRHRQP